MTIGHMTIGLLAVGLGAGTLTKTCGVAIAWQRQSSRSAAKVFPIVRNAAAKAPIVLIGSQTVLTNKSAIVPRKAIAKAITKTIAKCHWTKP